MGTGEEIQALRQRGMTDGEIIGALKSKGIPESEIVNSLSQNNIKAAVGSPDPNAGITGGMSQNLSGGYDGNSQDNMGDRMPIAGMPSNEFSQQGGYPSSPNSPPMMNRNNKAQESMQTQGVTQEGYTPPAMQQDQYGAGAYSGMQPSMMTPGGGDYPANTGGGFGGDEYVGGGAQEYVPRGGAEQAGGDYGYDQYQNYQEAMSTDVITEIAEQVVNEKLSYLRDKLESVLDIRTVMDARMSNLNERLRRLEKIMDQLQLSVLQKVGEYVNDVKDIKKEIEETQKTFSAVHKKKHSKR